MDQTKIEGFFQQWKSQKLLSRKGSLVSKKISGCLVVSIFLLVMSEFILWLNMENLSPVQFVLSTIVLLAIIALLIYSPSPLSFHFYPERFDRFLLGAKTSFSYSDISAVKKRIWEEEVNNQKVVRWEISIRVEKGGTYKKFTITDGYNNSKLVNSFFASCLRDVYFSEPFYQSMLELFAVMIVLKKDPDSYQAGYGYVVEHYLKNSKYKTYSYQSDLSYKISRGKMNQLNVRSVCSDILVYGVVSYDERLELLSALFGCAYASDDLVDQEELDLLWKIAYYLVIKEWDFVSLKYRFVGKNQERSKKEKRTDYSQWKNDFKQVHSTLHKHACAQLGIGENATLDDVKSAYRTKVKLFHPDMLPENASLQDMEEASFQFRAVKEAYDFLCGELVAVAEPR